MMAMLRQPSGAHLGGVLGAAGLALTLVGCAFIANRQAGPTAFLPSVSRAPAALEAQHPAGEGVEAPPGVTPASEAPETPPPEAAQTPAPGHADFIVKFKDAAAIDDTLAHCRRNRAAAEAYFREWASKEAPFEAMELTGCSYSGELLLRYAFAPGAPIGEAQVDRLLARIRAHENVAYADPDFTAYPGEMQE